MAHPFHTAAPDEIREGRTAEVHLRRARAVLESKEENPIVSAEVRAAAFPEGWPWAVFAGLEEALALLEGRDVEVRAAAEGSVTFPEEPVLTVTGRYLEFAELETALLGMLCQASGVATMAARCKLAAEGRPVYPFGTRLVHPAVAGAVERAAYVGGCDGVVTVKGGELTGRSPVGTMPHALVLLLGEREAWTAFDRVMDRTVPRVVLVDTLMDEKVGALAAVEALDGRLAAVRLDLSAAAGPDLEHLVREVRWELDARGHSGVRILVSGDLDEWSIPGMNRHAAAYGVERAITAAPAVDFSLDVVEVRGEPRARRGKLSGRKHLWRCDHCGNRGIAPEEARLRSCPECGQRLRDLLTPVLEGRRGPVLPPVAECREWALREVAEAPDPFA